MRKSIAFILVIFLSFLSFGQGQLCNQDLFPKQSTNRYWGYVNLFDQWQITPIFTTANPFRGKTAVVLRGMKYGAVNCEGRLIVPCKYDEIKDFVGGKAWVKKDGLWGLVNDEGRDLLFPLYKEVKEVSKYSDQVWVKYGQSWGVYDLDKEDFVYEPQFSEVQVLDASTSLVKKGELSGIIRVDSSHIVYPIQIAKVMKVAPYRLAIQEKGAWGMITYHGRLLVKPEFDTLFFKYKNLIQIEKNNKVGLVNYKGKVVTPVKFDAIADFHQGGARICLDKEYGFISARGKLVLPINFTYADRFANELCVAKKDKGYGLINAKNEWIIKDTFDLIEPSHSYSYYVATYKERKFYINEKGVIQNKETFFFIDLQCKTTCVRVKTGNYYLYDFQENNYITSVGFDSISPQNLNMFVYREEGKFGVLDTTGKIKIPNLYSSIRIDTKGLQYFFVEVNGKWGLRLMNKELIPIDNEELRFIDNYYLLAKSDGFEGIYSKSGKVIAITKYNSLKIEMEYGDVVWPIIYRNKKKIGLINKQGVELKLPKHETIIYLKNRLYGYLHKGKWGILNKKGEVLVEEKYEELGVYEKGLINVKLDGKWLTINKKGIKK